LDGHVKFRRLAGIEYAFEHLANPGAILDRLACVTIEIHGIVGPKIGQRVGVVLVVSRNILFCPLADCRARRAFVRAANRGSARNQRSYQCKCYSAHVVPPSRERPTLRPPTRLIYVWPLTTTLAADW
jgi:hypothetical protein